MLSQSQYFDILSSFNPRHIQSDMADKKGSQRLLTDMISSKEQQRSKSVSDVDSITTQSPMKERNLIHQMRMKVLIEERPKSKKAIVIPW